MKTFKRNFPFGIVILFILLFFSPFILRGRLPIPADTIMGMYHPWIDSRQSEFPNGVPFKNFQITDAVRQQYPWRLLAWDSLKKGQLPLWNPYNFSGTPLLANMQAAPFYPLNILYVFLRFADAWSWQVLLQMLMGGVFMYLYLRQQRVTPFSASFGSLVFIGSGFFIAWLVWNTTVQAYLWLPLILLTVDKIMAGGKSLRWAAILVFALSASLLAGYLQPAFYVITFTFLYILAKVRITGSLRKIPLLAICFVVFLFLTAVQWIPTLQFILQSARNIDQANWQRPDWFLPWQNLIQFVAPDFFGNPATLNYFGVWNYQEFVGYIGLLPLVFAIFAVIFRRDRKTFYYTVVGLSALLLALPTLPAKLPYMLNLPFISTAQPSRIIMIVDFSLAVLASLGLDYFLGHEFTLKKRLKMILVPLAIPGTAILALWIWVLNHRTGNFLISERNLYFPALFFAFSVFLCLLVVMFAVRNRLLSQIAKYGLIFILLLDLLRFGTKYTPFTDRSYLYPDTIITRYLQTHTGSDHSRILALDDRIFPPNFNSVYGLSMPGGYDPLYLKRYGELMAASERNRADIHTPWGFNRIIVPKNYRSPFLKLLGVRYLLSLGPLSDINLKEVMSEGNTKVYEDSGAFPRAFMVGSVVTAGSKQAVLEKMFTVDLRNTAVIEEAVPAGEFTAGRAEISYYSANRIEIFTQSPGESFLILTDSFYPGWQAMIDGKESKIYLSDYNFRGLIVPAGKHKVEYNMGW